MMNKTEIYVFRYGRVKISSPSSDISVAEYSGIVNIDCFSILRQVAIEKAQNKQVLVIDTCKVVVVDDLTCFIEPNPDALTYLPGVVICREDQLYLWIQYAQKLARFGVVRSVFLDSERDQAMRIARTYSLFFRLPESDLKSPKKQMRA